MLFLLLNPANKSDYVPIVPIYPAALCWVIWFCFITDKRKAWIIFSSALKKRQHSPICIYKETFSGPEDTHCIHHLKRPARKTSVCFLFSVRRAVATKPGLDYLILIALKPHPKRAGAFPLVSVVCCLSIILISSGVFDKVSPSTFSLLAAHIE